MYISSNDVVALLLFDIIYDYMANSFSSDISNIMIKHTCIQTCHSIIYETMYSVSIWCKYTQSKGCQIVSGESEWTGNLDQHNHFRFYLMLFWHASKLSFSQDRKISISAPFCRREEKEKVSCHRCVHRVKGVVVQE